MGTEMSSRERVLTAIEGKQPDHVPCCFMIFSALSARCLDHFDFVNRQLKLGLDAVVALHAREAEDPRVGREHRDLPGLPVRYHPEVMVRQGREDAPDGRALLHKEYLTPAGALRTTLQVSDDWRYGEQVPFLDDWLIPRSTRRLISGPRDLEPLGYLLQPPTGEDLVRFREWAERARAFAGEKDLAVSAGWGAVGDMACWLVGMQELMLLAVDQPDFTAELLGQIAAWNAERMAIVLEAGVDLFIRRGWYEGVDFWSPRLYERFLLPSLRAEAEMAHQAGARFGYIMTSGSTLLLDLMVDAGVDVLIGVDPVQGRGTDLADLKARAGGRIALWGGVNGFLTVERGEESEVRRAVEEAMGCLAPGGGFVLSPVDNVTTDTPETWRNVAALIDEWQAICGRS